MNDTELNDFLDTTFLEFGISTGTLSQDNMTTALRARGVPDFKIDALPGMLRHPASSGTVRMFLGDYYNYITIHEDHYHVLSVPIELDIEL